MVSNERKCSPARHRRSGGPCCGAPPPRWRATRPESMVVWLARPTRTRSRSKSKPGDVALPNRSHSAADVAPVLDEVADQPRLVHVEHHEVATLRVLHHLARGRLGLLVPVLAVDDRGEPVARVALHPLPHVQHRPAGRIHQHAADPAKPLEVADGDPEGRQDHHVVRRDGREVEGPLIAAHEEADTHVPQLLVDVGVVDDLADEVKPAVGELGPGLVGVVHRAVHAVAEAELPRQPEGQRSDGEAVLVGPQRLHHGAVVVGRELAFDLRLEAETPAEVGALHDRESNPPTPRTLLRGLAWCRRDSGTPPRTRRARGGW